MGSLVSGSNYDEEEYDTLLPDFREQKVL